MIAREFYTTSEAAKILKCHHYSIYTGIWWGKIRAVYLPGHLLRITHEELSRIQHEKIQLQTDLTLREAAAILSCSESSIRRFIKNRKLVAQKIRHTWRIKPEALSNFIVSEVQPYYGK